MPAMKQPLPGSKESDLWLLNLARERIAAAVRIVRHRRRRQSHAGVSVLPPISAHLAVR